ncbi:MAG: NYN domain-containing protein [Kyrpidia sp.]|nr:NYN domain-containing protein [Kyrpidia sp.]
MEDYVIVDGYNVIGASQELAEMKGVSMEEARGRLLEWLGEYQAYTGKKVIAVFDGRCGPDGRTSGRVHGVDVYFTREKETADQWIERVVRERVEDRDVRIYVATSDELEQRLSFGWGGLRISAREFLEEIRKVREEVSRRVRNQGHGKAPVGERLSENVAEIFEKWRRS